MADQHPFFVGAQNRQFPQPFAEHKLAIDPPVPVKPVLTAEHQKRQACQERNKLNRSICDNRTFCYHNILIFLLQTIGFDVVVRRPPKLKPCKTISRIPVVRILLQGQVCFDCEELRKKQETLIQSETNKLQLEIEKSKRHAKNLEKIEIFNKMVELIEKQCNDIKIKWSTSKPPKYQDMPPLAKISEIYIRPTETIINKDNVIEFGRPVYDFFIRQLASLKKNETMQLERYRKSG